MNRNSILYKIRRRLQMMAARLCGYRIMTKVYYRILLGKKCNLDNPESLNEKICWLKLNDFGSSRLIINCTDKYRVRNYVSKKIGRKYLVPLLGFWEKAKDIDFEKLPEKFILKCNHGCAYNIVTDNKKKLNTEKVRKQLDSWLKEDFSLFNAEPQYQHIKRRIICEGYLGKDIVDYKFFCCNGKIVYYYVSSGLLDDRTAKMCNYLPDDTIAPFQRKSYTFHDFGGNGLLEEMKRLAEKLAGDFCFVRVDFMVADRKIFFSELTFTPGGGYNDNEPQYLFDRLGEQLDIK